MSGAIWKFTIPVEDEFTVLMPVDARVVHVEAQFDRPCIWAIVGPTAKEDPASERRFFTRGTGHLLPDKGEYLGTYQLSAGRFIGHVFEAQR